MALFSSLHELNRFNCLFICQSSLSRGTVERVCQGASGAVSAIGASVSNAVNYAHFPQHIFIKTQLPTSLLLHFLLYTLVPLERPFRNVFMGNNKDFWQGGSSYHLLHYSSKAKWLYALIMHSYLHLTSSDPLNIPFW